MEPGRTSARTCGAPLSFRDARSLLTLVTLITRQAVRRGSGAWDPGSGQQAGAGGGRKGAIEGPGAGMLGW